MKKAILSKVLKNILFFKLSIFCICLMPSTEILYAQKTFSYNAYTFHIRLDSNANGCPEHKLVYLTNNNDFQTLIFDINMPIITETDSAEFETYGPLSSMYVGITFLTPTNSHNYDDHPIQQAKAKSATTNVSQAPKDYISLHWSNSIENSMVDETQQILIPLEKIIGNGYSFACVFGDFYLWAEPICNFTLEQPKQSCQSSYWPLYLNAKPECNIGYEESSYQWEYQCRNNDFKTYPTKGSKIPVSLRNMPEAKVNDNLIFRIASRTNSNKNTSVIRFYPDLPQLRSIQNPQYLPPNAEYLSSLNLQFSRPLDSTIEEKINCITLYDKITEQSNGIFNIAEAHVICQIPVLISSFSSSYNCSISIPTPYMIKAGSYYVTAEGSVKGKSNLPTSSENTDLPDNIRSAMFSCVPLKVVKSELSIKEVLLSQPICHNEKGSINVKIVGNFGSLYGQPSPIFYVMENGTLTKVNFRYIGTFVYPRNIYTEYQLDSVLPGTYHYQVVLASTPEKKGYFSANIVNPSPINTPTYVHNINGTEYKNGKPFPTEDGYIHIKRDETTGGTAPYSFYYVCASNLATKHWISSDNIPFSKPESIYLTITDSNNCSSVQYLSVSDNLNVLEVALSIVDSISCNGRQDGSILATLKQGKGPIVYQWFKNRRFIATNTNISFLKNLGPGYYGVKITNTNNGMISTQYISLPEPPVFSVSGNIEDVYCYGNSTGRISSTIQGGTQPYMRQWNNGSLHADISNLTAGTYILQAIDAHNCRDTATFVIKQPSTPFRIIIDTILHAYYDQFHQKVDGGIHAHTQGGTKPHQAIIYGNNENQNALTAGSYLLTAYDYLHCPADTTISIQQYDSMQVNITSLHEVSCYNGYDASCKAIIIGGVPPYQLLWSNGKTSNTITDLTAGTYQVNVTDATGSKGSAQIIFNDPPPLEIQNLKIVHPNYFGCIYGNCSANATNGQIHLNIKGGTPTYHCLWSIKDSNTSYSLLSDTTQSISGLKNGIYHLYVKDQNQCSQEWDFSIPNIKSLYTKIQITKPLLCHHANDGQVEVLTTGGIPPYHYEWIEKGVRKTEKGTRLSALRSGNIFVKVSDSTGIISYDSINLSAPDTLITQLDSCVYPSYYGSTNGLYMPNKKDGKICIKVQGGTKPYTYQWSLFSKALTEENSNKIRGLKGGIYTVQITDSNACTTSTPFTLVEYQCLKTKIEIIDSISCRNEHNGKLKALIEGGAPPYNITWFDEKKTEIAKDKDSISNLPAGHYSILVSDIHHVNSFFSISLPEPSRLESEIRGENAWCKDSKNGFATVKASGGTPPYSYRWFIDHNEQSELSDTLRHLNDALVLVYTKDAHGCISSTQQEFRTPSALTLNEEKLHPSYSGCLYGIPKDTFYDGRIEIFVNGGTAPYRYFWNTNDTSSTISNLNSGFYSVSVVDKNHCTINRSFTLKRPVNLKSYIKIIDSIPCFQNQKGSLSVLVSGGTPPYKYIWFKNGNVITEKNDSILHTFGQGVFSVKITDSKGVVSKDSLIFLSPLPLTTQACIQNLSGWKAQDGSIKLLSLGGTPPYVYLWNTGDTNSNLYPLGKGSYSVCIQDKNHCTSLKNYRIESPDSLCVLHHFVHHCTQNKIDGSINVEIQGGVPPYRCLWKQVFGKTIYQTSSRNLSFRIDNINDGNYIFQITDTNGYTIRDTFIVKRSLALSMSLAIKNNISCFRANNGILSAQINGGNPPYSISWWKRENESWQQIIGEKEVLSNVKKGYYLAITTDNEGYTVSDSITINEPDSLFVAIQFLPALKNDTIYDGKILLKPHGGTAPYRYFWSTNENTDSIYYVKNQYYHGMVLDNHSCVWEKELHLELPSRMKAHIEEKQSISCHNKHDGVLSICIDGGSPPYKILWNTGDTNLCIKNLCSGLYTATIVDYYKSETIISYHLNEPDSLMLHYTLVHPLCKGTKNGSIQSFVSGGSYPYTYFWSNGNQTPSISLLGEGKYILSIMDKNFCLQHDTIALIDPALLSADLHVDYPICHNQSGEINVFPKGGTPPYSCQWYHPKGHKSFGHIAQAIPGKYILQIKDSNTCLFDTTILLPNPSPLALNLNDQQTLCTGQYIKICPNIKDTNNLQYLWIYPNGESSTDSSILTKQAGLHKLTVIQHEQCLYKDSIFVHASPDSIRCDFWVSSLLYQGESCIAVNISGAIPDSITWTVPSSIPILNQEGNYLEVYLADTGTFPIEMISYKGACWLSKTNWIQVLSKVEKSAEKNDISSILKHLRINPNPSLNECSLEIESMDICQVHCQLIQAANGKLLKTDHFTLYPNIPENRLLFNKTTQSGIYILMVHIVHHQKNITRALKIIRL
ncbi:MAG: SprB repeat-containing protein [Bacteroidales bacterium]